MKQPLTIKRTAELYDLSADTLRYYEKIGLLSPQREQGNGYRMYRSDDFAKLNMIVSMLRMNFSLKEVKHYLDHHNLQTNIDLLTQEMTEIDEAIDRLQARKRRVQTSLSQLATALYEAPREQMRLIDYAERPCVIVAEPLDSGKDLPLLSAERAALPDRAFELDIFSMTPAFVLDSTLLSFDDARRVKQALLYVDPPLGVEDVILPAGTYLSFTVKGSSNSDLRAWELMTDYLQANQLEAAGDLIEFWTISEYNSSNENEYAHTLQVLTKPASL